MFPLTLSPLLSTPSSCLLMLPPVCMPPLTGWAWVSVKGTGMYDCVDAINSSSSPFPFFSSLATSLVFLAFCPPIHLTFSSYVLVGPCKLLQFLYTFLLDGKWSLSGVLWVSYPWGCSSPSLKTPRFPHCPATKRVINAWHSGGLLFIAPVLWWTSVLTGHDGPYQLFFHTEAYCVSDTGPGAGDTTVNKAGKAPAFVKPIV